jgi:hypothetical protein
VGAFVVAVNEPGLVTAGVIIRQVLRRTHGFGFLLAVLGAVIVLSVAEPAPSQASGSLVTYTDRSGWDAAVGGTTDGFVDFEEFTDDALFSASNPVVAGPLTIVQTEGEGNTFNRVDVPPVFRQYRAGRQPERVDVSHGRHR